MLPIRLRVEAVGQGHADSLISPQELVRDELYLYRDLRDGVNPVQNCFFAIEERSPYSAGKRRQWRGPARRLPSGTHRKRTAKTLRSSLRWQRETAGLPIRLPRPEDRCRR